MNTVVPQKVNIVIMYLSPMLFQTYMTVFCGTYKRR